MLWNWMARAFEIIEMIPATFFGVVFGSFISLAGVILSNLATDRRLREQLQHDREQVDRQRELELKKDVFLAASESISAGINSIAKFANLDIGDVTRDYADKSSAVAKVYVIARDETLSALGELTDAIEAAQLRLTAKRLPLIRQKTQIQALQDLINESAKERARFLELMKQHNLDGAADSRRWDAIQRNYEYEQKRIDDAIHEQNSLASALHSENVKYLKECIDETAILRRLVIPTLIAVRRELELPLDQDRYSNSVEASIRNQDAVVREFIQKITATEGIPPQIGG